LWSSLLCSFWSQRASCDTVTAVIHSQHDVQYRFADTPQWQKIGLASHKSPRPSENTSTFVYNFMTYHADRQTNRETDTQSKNVTSLADEMVNTAFPENSSNDCKRQFMMKFYSPLRQTQADNIQSGP